MVSFGHFTYSRFGEVLLFLCAKKLVRSTILIYEIDSDNTDFLEQATGLIKKYDKDQDTMWISPTQFPDGDNVKVYKLRGGVDIDLATEVGLGVVLYQGELMIYSPYPIEDPMDAVFEMIMLKVYLQLMHPEVVDQKLKESFEENAELIQTSIIINRWSHMERLRDILEV